MSKKVKDKLLLQIKRFPMDLHKGMKIKALQRNPEGNVSDEYIIAIKKYLK